MEYEIENHIEQLFARIIAMERQIGRMEIERRLTTLETVQESMLERENARIHHTKIVPNHEDFHT
jgi:hypothetical protein